MLKDILITKEASKRFTKEEEDERARKLVEAVQEKMRRDDAN